MRRTKPRTALAVAAGALTLASCASGPAAAPPSQPSQACAWPSVVGVQTFNKAAPDPLATYWDQPITTGASTRITVSGTYPDARYFTLSVYTPYGQSAVGSSLTDYQIAPRPGSVNPWQRQAAPGGRYAVTVAPTATPGQANVLPLPAGTSGSHPGYLIYRVYLPNGGDVSRLTPPAITLTDGKTSQTLAVCRTHTPISIPGAAPGTTPTTTAPTTTPPPPGTFYGLPASEYVTGLADANTAYAQAYIIRPPAGDVMVVTAKAPAFPPGTTPLPWPRAGVDMRYWSMCMTVATKGAPTVANKLPDGSTDYGCREDYQTQLVNGTYAYVIGTEAQRAAISQVPGATFLPLPTAPTPRLYFLLLRNKLVSPGFTQSAQSITKAVDPAAAAAAMGPYYPKVSTCPLSTLTANGLAACESR